jgi:hypothetical protein
MSDRAVELLTTRLDALSSAAIGSGADAPVIARLLEAASVATLHAVALDLLRRPQPAPAVQAPPAKRLSIVRLLDAA